MLITVADEENHKTHDLSYTIDNYEEDNEEEENHRDISDSSSDFISEKYSTTTWNNQSQPSILFVVKNVDILQRESISKDNMNNEGGIQHVDTFMEKGIESPNSQCENNSKKILAENKIGKNALTYPIFAKS